MAFLSWAILCILKFNLKTPLLAGVVMKRPPGGEEHGAVGLPGFPSTLHHQMCELGIPDPWCLSVLIFEMRLKRPRLRA